MPKDNTTLRAGQYWDVPGQPVNGVKSIHVLQLWYQLVFGGAYVEFEYLDTDGKHIHQNVTTTADQFYKNYVEKSGLTLREGVESKDLEGDVTDATLRGSIASLYREEPDTLTEGSYRVKLSNKWWIVSGTGIDDSTCVQAANSLISILQSLGCKATTDTVVSDPETGVVKISKSLVSEDILDKALSGLDAELKKSDECSDAPQSTLRDSILSLYGSSLDEDVHTLSTEETVEDLLDRSMTMLDDLLNDEASLEPRDQFDLIDKTLDQALKTVEDSNDLDVETKSYLKQDIEHKRQEVNYQKGVYLSRDVEESLEDDEGDGPFHYGDFLIRDEKDGVSVWDKKGNFIQTADTRSEAIRDIDHMSTETEKTQPSNRRDPRGKDIAWDGYDY